MDKQQRCIPIIIVGIFTLMACFTGYGSYSHSAQMCERDLNFALSETLKHKKSEAITPDTIRVFRQNLTIDVLKNKSFVAFSVADENSYDGVLKSKAQKWKRGDSEQIYRGYSLCSFWDVVRMSDQRLSLSLLIVGMISAAFSVLVIRRRQEALGDFIFVGDVALSVSDGFFYDKSKKRIAFTPMQRQFMSLLFHADGHEISQHDVCEKLWHGKDNAAESLYTLVRRLRKVLGEATDLSIELERGKGYRLIS